MLRERWGHLETGAGGATNSRMLQEAWADTEREDRAMSPFAWERRSKKLSITLVERIH